MESTKLMVVNFLKVLGCGAIIAAIGFGFVVLTPDGVDRVGADVFWTGPSSLGDSNQTKFVNVLKDQGFSDPQPYDWNGNTVYFSQGETQESPQEVSMRLQTAFVNEGLNKRAYPFPPDPNIHERDGAAPRAIGYSTFAAKDYFSGGMIPIIDTGDHVALSGVETIAEHEDLEGLELMKMVLTYPGDDYAKMFNNVRYIEAFRPEGSRTTQKIAMFGDGEIDLNLFQPGAGNFNEGRSYQEAVPSCPGCERNTRFSGKESQADYQMTTYNSPDSVENVMDFYRHALGVRGWEVSTGMAAVRYMRERSAPFDAPDLNGRMETYVRNGKMVQIHAYATHDFGSHVNIFQGN